MCSLRREAGHDSGVLNLEGDAVVNDERQLTLFELISSDLLRPGRAADGMLVHDPSILYLVSYMVNVAS